MLKKLLGFDPQTMALRTEIIAGITTFLTMSYILAVNPSILATTGMDKGAVFTATALASALATLLLAFMAKLPFAQAPSMALNAFFAFTLVQGMGYSWQTAMTAMFVEGVIFILITFLNVREVILNSIPMNLRFAISAGIGMFIAFVGLKNAGIIVPNPATFVMFGPFTPVSILAMVGILLSGILVLRKVKGALFYSILICTLIGIPLGVTEIPDGFLPVSIPHSMAPTFCQFDFNEFFTLDMAIVIFTLLFMNIFDTVGTLVGLASKTGIMEEDGQIPHVKEAMMSDAIGTTVGSMMGSSTITTYVESASGIAEGGRSGFTSLVTQQGGRRNSSRFFARNPVPQKVVFRNNPHTLHQYRNRIISRPQQFLFFLQQFLVICAKYPIQALEYFHKSCVSTHFFLTTCTRKWYKGSRIASLEICPFYGTVVMRKRLDTI